MGGAIIQAKPLVIASFYPRKSPHVARRVTAPAWPEDLIRLEKTQVFIYNGPGSSPGNP